MAEAVTESVSVNSKSWVPYVAPMALFSVFTFAESQLAEWLPGLSYTALYTIKAAIVAAALIACRSTWKDIRWDVKALPMGVVVGIAVLIAWVFIERFLPYPHTAARVGFNPYQSISGDAERIAFLSVRFIGLAILVPVMEELFWRSFALRFASNPDWEKLPIGSFTLQGFLVVAGLFALIHPEWISAFLCALAYGWLLWKTKSVFACVVAHAVTNAGLGTYVLITGHWALW